MVYAKAVEIALKKEPFTVIKGQKICDGCCRCCGRFDMSYTSYIFKPIYYTEGYLHAEIIAALDTHSDNEIGETMILQLGFLELQVADKVLLKICKAGYNSRKKRAVKKAEDNAKAVKKFKKKEAARKKR